MTEELETHAALDVVSLDDLAESLIADLPNHRSGKTAKTIMSGTVMRAVIVALAEGAHMSEHDSPPAATLHVIRGEVTLTTKSKEWKVRPGELVPVPRQRHSVHAQADSAFLLTVALR